MIGADRVRWVSVTNKINNPEGTSICPGCSKSYFSHPNYPKLGIHSCVGPGHCYLMEDIAQKMMSARGLTYINLEKNGDKRTITFTCDQNHPSKITYDSLKKGGSCRTCLDSSRKKTKVKTGRYVRVDCECIGVSGSRPVICIHHNHKVDPNGGSEEWNYELNKGIRPEQVAPTASRKFWYTCPKEWCHMSYSQIPANRSTGTRCPYCSSALACEWNSLARNYPDLAQDWDTSNTMQPNAITSHSRIKVKWIHVTPDGTIHRWEASPCDRTKKLSGCPWCNNAGHYQKKGGHEWFGKEATEIHSGKYTYNDPYKGSHTPINITCPILDRHQIPHGDFLQTPHSHKSGQGCPKCNDDRVQSKLMTDIQNALLQLGYQEGVHYAKEVKLDGLRQTRLLKLDIFIPSLRLAIEADGKQHFVPITSWSNCDQLSTIQSRDKIKDLYLMEQGYSLLRFPYTYTSEMVRTILVQVIPRIANGERIYLTYLDFWQETVSKTSLLGVSVVTISKI